jgi:hypothetical protein
MKILMDWMLEEGNYSKYCGKDNNGVRKQHFASQLAVKMKELTLSTNRTAKQVMEKIRQIEDSFRDAHIFATSETGAGIQEKQGDETFKDIVRKKCSYYYELLEIMADRSGSKPKVTNDPSELDCFSKDLDVEASAAEAADSPSVEPDDGPVIQNLKEGVNQDSTQRSSAVSSIASNNTNKGSSKKKRKTSNCLMDENTVRVLEEGTKFSKEKIKETMRHNKHMESMEKARLEIETKRLKSEEWKGKSEELDYKMKLVRQCQELQASGMSESKIVRLFLEMQSVIAALNGNDSDSDNS